MNTGTTTRSDFNSERDILGRRSSMGGVWHCSAARAFGNGSRLVR